MNRWFVRKKAMLLAPKKMLRSAIISDVMIGLGGEVNEEGSRRSRNI